MSEQWYVVPACFAALYAKRHPVVIDGDVATPIAGAGSVTGGRACDVLLLGISRKRRASGMVVAAASRLHDEPWVNPSFDREGRVTESRLGPQGQCDDLEQRKTQQQEQQQDQQDDGWYLSRLQRRTAGVRRRGLRQPHAVLRQPQEDSWAGRFRPL